jgi:hypothetical protein
MQGEPLTLSPLITPLLSIASGKASDKICVVSRGAGGASNRLFVSCIFYEMSNTILRLET